jgi:D-serine deaminase-like pyridoxal phosphate-dependent protein
MATPSLQASASPSLLRETFVGKTLSEVPAPAVILDAAVVRRNCALMLEATDALGVDFRAHVKTHKV